MSAPERTPDATADLCYYASNVQGSLFRNMLPCKSPQARDGQFLWNQYKNKQMVANQAW